MGYEIKLYIGQISEWDTREIKNFSVIGMVDICKPGQSYIRKVEEKEEYQPVYFYATDGNTQVTKDFYSKDLVAIPANVIIEALQKDIETGYRRYNIALDFIKSIVSNWQNEQVFVIIFGY